VSVLRLQINSFGLSFSALGSTRFNGLEIRQTEGSPLREQPVDCGFDFRRPVAHAAGYSFLPIFAVVLIPDLALFLGREEYVGTR
jgi:hypothetical protein